MRREHKRNRRRVKGGKKLFHNWRVSSYIEKNPAMIFRFFLSVAAICCFLNIADAQFYTTDVSFGNAGLVQTTYNGNHLNKATTCAVQPDSKVITAGYTENQGGGPINPFVVRLK